MPFTSSCCLAAIQTPFSYGHSFNLVNALNATNRRDRDATTQLRELGRLLPYRIQSPSAERNSRKEISRFCTLWHLLLLTKPRRIVIRVIAPAKYTVLLFTFQHENPHVACKTTIFLLLLLLFF